MRQIQIGQKVDFRGNVGKIVSQSEKSISIHCSSKNKAPYNIGVSKKLFFKEGKIL